MNFHNFKSNEFIASVPYMQDDVTWCVSRSKALPRWRNIYYIPQDAITYVVGIILYIFVIICTYLLTTFEKNPFDILILIISIQVLVGFNTVLNPNKMMFRLLFTKFMFIAYWLVQIFSAFLISYISRIMYEKQIGTVDELIDTRFRLAGQHHDFVYLNNSAMVR